MADSINFSSRTMHQGGAVGHHETPHAGGEHAGSVVTGFLGCGPIGHRIAAERAESADRGEVAGALLAALLPPTRIEQKCVTGVCDQLWNRATELGHDAAERVRELAESTTRASRQ